jgi:hypothetical protein
LSSVLSGTSLNSIKSSSIEVSLLSDLISLSIDHDNQSGNFVSSIFSSDGVSFKLQDNQSGIFVSSFLEIIESSAISFAKISSTLSSCISVATSSLVSV